MNDQDLTIAVLAGVIVFILIGGFIISFILLYNKRQIAFKKQIFELETQFQQEILHAQLEIQEQTLLNVSQELHDNIGQILTLIKVTMNNLILQNIIDEKHLSELKDLVTKAIQDVRDISKSLNSDRIHQLGLCRIMEQEINAIERASNISISSEIVAGNPDLDSKVELIIFRIIQEVFNNIIKHSSASNVIFRMEIHENSLVVSITDNGCGFSSAIEQGEVPKLLGSGIRNMERRASMINGRLTIENMPGVGTAVKLEVPLEQRLEKR